MNQDADAQNLGASEAGEETCKPESDIKQVNDELVLLPIVITTNLPNNHNNRISSSSTTDQAANATNGSSGAALRPDEIAPNHIAWSLLDSKDGRLLCCGSRKIANRPGELASAIDELNTQIGARNFLPITCGPLTLRQNLHPASFRAKIELADSFYRYADLVDQFWSNREQAKEAQPACYLDERQYELDGRHQFTATSANYCYCCDTTYYAHHTATLRPDGQMSFDLYPPASAQPHLYPPPLLPHLSQQPPREQANPNYGLRSALQSEHAGAKPDKSGHDQEVKPAQEQCEGDDPNKMPTRDDSVKTGGGESHNDDQINLAPYSEMSGHNFEEPSASGINISDSNNIRSVSSGSSYSRKNSNLNFSFHPLSNTEAERNEMQQVDEILKCKSFSLI